MSTGISEKITQDIKNNDDKVLKIYKKGVHFNLTNVEDKIIVDYLKANKTNFSALAKQLMLQYIDEQVITVSQVRKIARKEINDVFKDKIIDEAFQNQIRKIVIESMISLSFKVPETVLKNKIVNSKSEKELIIDNAVNSYIEEDLDAMNFSGGTE